MAAEELLEVPSPKATRSGFYDDAESVERSGAEEEDQTQPIQEGNDGIQECASGFEAQKLANGACAARGATAASAR